MSAASVRQRFQRSAAAGGTVAALPFLWALSGGRATLLRRARPDGLFSDVFDLQATALLSGHFHLKPGALSIESFIVDGRTYAYFPPFPAILRMPVLALWGGASGHLTSISMLIAWVLLLIGATALLWEVRRLNGLHHSISTAGCILTGTFVAALGGGSVVVYLAAMPWVYHEVYLWSIATSVLAAWSALRLLHLPTWRRGVDLTVFTSACILTRTTVGFGCVLSALVCAVALRQKHTEQRRPAWVLAAAAAAVPLALACAVTWIKFGSPFNFLPLDAQAWTQVNEQRRRALATNGGGLTNIDFLPTTLRAYFDPRGIRFIKWFPFITLPARPPAVIGDAYFDQTYRAGSMTSFMPLMVALTAAGLVSVARRARSPLSRAMIPLCGSAVAMFGVLDYGYMAHRYLGDLMPFFVVGFAVGMAVSEPVLDRWRSARIGVVTVIVALAGWSVAANGLVAAAASARTAEGAQLRRFVEHQLRWSPGRVTFVHVADAVPQTGDAETVTIVGDCAALLVATGETESPWIVVGGNGARATVAVGGGGIVPVFTVADSAGTTTDVAVESTSSGIRLIATGLISRASGWASRPITGIVTLNLELDLHASKWIISLDGSSVLRIPATRFDVDWRQRYAVPTPILGDPRLLWGAPLRDRLCDRALGRAESLASP